MIEFIDRDKENHLRLMVRDPSHLFAYWDIDDQTLSELTEKPDASAEANRWVLRLVRLQSGEATDIGIDIYACNWYIPVAPESVYEGEIGVYFTNGSYRSVVRGNLVRTPPKSISNLIDPDWFVSDEEFLRLAAGMPGLSASSYRGVPGSRAPERLEAQGNLAPAHDAQIKPRK